MAHLEIKFVKTPKGPTIELMKQGKRVIMEVEEEASVELMLKLGTDILDAMLDKDKEDEEKKEPKVSEEDDASEEDEDEGTDIETTEDEEESSDSVHPSDQEFVQEHPDDQIAAEMVQAALEAEEESSADTAATDSGDGESATSSYAPSPPRRRVKELERKAFVAATPGVSIGAKLLNVKCPSKPKKPSTRKTVGPKATKRVAKALFQSPPRPAFLPFPPEPVVVSSDSDSDCDSGTDSEQELPLPPCPPYTQVEVDMDSDSVSLVATTSSAQDLERK